MTPILRTLAFALAGVVLLATGLARAENPENFRDFRTGVALKDYDPVAYFADGEAREGDPAHAHEWKGATWHFVSAENRDAFAASPEKYSPEYGGYWAYAVARGNAVPADPRAWTIVDDKLYRNLSPNVRKVWREDMRANIVRANNNWPEALIEEGQTGFEPQGASDR